MLRRPAMQHSGCPAAMVAAEARARRPSLSPRPSLKRKFLVPSQVLVVVLVHHERRDSAAAKPPTVHGIARRQRRPCVRKLDENLAQPRWRCHARRRRPRDVHLRRQGGGGKGECWVKRVREKSHIWSSLYQQPAETEGCPLQDEESAAAASF